MTARYLIGDTRDLLDAIPDGSVDLIVTSPPFLALRSYLPADHPDKHREIGSEATPADFLSTLLALTVEWRRVLAPHGSLCVELGDTYSGAGGENHLWDTGYSGGRVGNNTKKPNGSGATRDTSRGWPLAKSMCGIPTLYAWSLAYGRNLLRPEHTLDPWRIRNLLVWARPNPPVGALGDKFRPATSYITVACTSPKRWFDLDAVRTESKKGHTEITAGGKYLGKGNPSRKDNGAGDFGCDPAGAPPLDWHTDCDDGTHDGDMLWALPTAPYPGSHFATYPPELPARLIKAMCPMQVCRVCGEPRRRIVEASYVDNGGRAVTRRSGFGRGGAEHGSTPPDGGDNRATRVPNTLGWTDCGHGDYRPGLVLDPFAGSGTTLAVATGAGRDAIGFDLDPRNADLARERVGMFLDVEKAVGA